MKNKKFKRDFIWLKLLFLKKLHDLIATKYYKLATKYCEKYGYKFEPDPEMECSGFVEMEMKDVMDPTVDDILYPIGICQISISKPKLRKVEDGK